MEARKLKFLKTADRISNMISLGFVTSPDLSNAIATKQILHFSNST